MLFQVNGRAHHQFKDLENIMWTASPIMPDLLGSSAMTGASIMNIQITSDTNIIPTHRGIHNLLATLQLLICDSPDQPRVRNKLRE